MRYFIRDLSLEQIKELEQNQLNCADLSPVTQRATFKLHNLEELIKEIKEDPKFGVSDDLTHNICITFVRDDLEKDHLGYDNCNNKAHLKDHGNKKGNKEYTQLIPIITGCHAKLNNMTRDYDSFEYFKVNERIPFVRSGGEGTGLIPPPPPPGND